MDRDTFLIAGVCPIADPPLAVLHPGRLRPRGPEHLGQERDPDYGGRRRVSRLDQAKVLDHRFHRHWAHLVPALHHAHRRPLSVRRLAGGWSSPGGNRCSASCHATRAWPWSTASLSRSVGSRVPAAGAAAAARQSTAWRVGPPELLRVPLPGAPHPDPGSSPASDRPRPTSRGWRSYQTGSLQLLAGPSVTATLGRGAWRKSAARSSLYSTSAIFQRLEGV